jgi:hypothetical protein
MVAAIDIIGALSHNQAVPTGIPTMSTLLDLVRARRAELEVALGPEALIDDERRLRALMMLQARAEMGDPTAGATWTAVQALFERAAPSQKS